jgi:hypothetical protein
MQIDYILWQSGFLSLQERVIKWNIQYRRKSYHTVIHPYIPFLIGDTEGHNTLVVITSLAPAASHSYVGLVSVPQ